MNSVKKVLLVHGDQAAGRTLTLLLAGTGYYVRCFARPEAAIEAAHGEWFDLSLVADPLPEMSTFSFIESLKKLQPSMAVLMLVNQLDLPSVIKGIRVAVNDVLAPEGDWTTVLQRVNGILQPGRTLPAGEVTAEELAAVEAMLAAASEVSAAARAAGSGAGGGAGEGRDALARECESFKSLAERLAREKTVLEAELRAQRELQTDTARKQTELTELRSEREILAAAQVAVDERARALTDAREALARERAALAAEREAGRPAGEVRRLKTDEVLSKERETLEVWRADLRAEDVRLREEAVKVRQGQVRLELDRRQLHEDLNLLREQEANLRAYEQRLRTMGEDAEANRVNRAAPRPSRDPFQRDPGLEAAWARLDRAMDMMEAERRSFSNEKMILKEELTRLKGQEEALQQRADELQERARSLDAREAQLSARPEEPESTRAAFTRAPFKTARAILAGPKR
jgi:DNA-binding NarL/FixJ family response regulator